MTLYRRLVMSSILLVGLAVAISTALAVTGQTRVLSDKLIGEGRRMARQIALSTGEAFRSLNWLSVESAIQNVASAEDVMFCKVVMPDGTVYIADDREYYGESIAPEVLNAGSSLIEDYVDRRTGRPGTLIVEQIEVGQERWWVLLALSSEGVNEAARSVLLNNLLAAVAITIPAIASALVLSKGISGPIAGLADAVRSFAEGRLDHAIDIRATGEVGILARSFNTMTEQLRDLVGSLEQRVAERTRELEISNTELEEARRRQETINRQLEEANERTRRRATQFQAVTEVGRAIAQVRAPERLLLEVTELISHHFGYYHVGIFMIDQAGRYAVLRAANSEGGQRMLARNHKLAVGGQGIVGYVTAAGEPRVALDVTSASLRRERSVERPVEPGADAVHLAHPDLPDTRSEMILPLQIGGQTIGALDLQSVEAQAFDSQDVAMLSVLADQVAIAIENARLLQQSLESLAEADEAQRHYLQQSWQGFLQQRPDLRFEYTLEGVPSALDVEVPTTQQAVARGESAVMSDVTIKEGDGTVARAALSVPIKLRGQVIGVIDLHEADKARTWTEHEIALVQAVAVQMAQTLEVARLFEQTQARAQREQLVGQITTRMRAASNVQDILRVTSEELAVALGVTRSVVRLRPQEASTQALSPEEALS